MIDRIIREEIRAMLGKGKAIILLGPRQAGKTTLLTQLGLNDEDVLRLNGDETDVANLFSEVSAVRISALLGQRKVIILDEAQRIENVGLKLKLITDTLPGVQVIATGSSSFELANKVNEPLTGRKWEYRLFPLSFAEMVNHTDLLTEKRLIPHRLIYGYYPEVVMNPGSERALLRQLTDSFLYKDILTWENIRKADRLTNLLQALAMQVGSQVSYNELAQICSMDPKTVEHYVILLEQAFIVFRLKSFSRNMRNELKNSRKIYFIDNGMLNAVLTNFDQIENRKDAGALWENFLVSERMKFNAYRQHWYRCYFWRTKAQQEIDYLEDSDGKLSAFEFKWKIQKEPRAPLSFMNAYPEAAFKTIHRDNVEAFLLG